jgi:hypothetical protein
MIQVPCYEYDAMKAALDAETETSREAPLACSCCDAPSTEQHEVPGMGMLPFCAEHGETYHAD